jgi:hypothetical protein
MSRQYTCNQDGQACQNFYTEDYAEVIEHIRSIHGLRDSIRRADALNVADTHGNLWYCFDCIGRVHVNHKSFKSNRAMWDHLNKCHDIFLDDIVVARSAV